MGQTPVEIVQSFLAGPTDQELVHDVCAPDVTYVSLNYANPDLKKSGSEQEFVKSRILGRFRENHEFSLGRCHALGFQQQVMEIRVAAAAAE